MQALDATCMINGIVAFSVTLASQPPAGAIRGWGLSLLGRARQRLPMAHYQESHTSFVDRMTLPSYSQGSRDDCSHSRLSQHPLAGWRE